MLLGSDWPSAVPSMDPWAGLEALVTRRDPTGKHPGELWPEQAVDVMAALGIFTGQNAAALLLDADLGSLAVGKRASFVVLDRDITTVDPATLDATRVLQTWVEGSPRFEAEPLPGPG
jgi:predicted amidohydrolase YtcJ